MKAIEGLTVMWGGGKMSNMKTSLNVRVSSWATAVLREKATQLGYVTTIGKMEGKGNISAMLDAIARGELEVVHRTGNAP